MGPNMYSVVKASLLTTTIQLVWLISSVCLAQGTIYQPYDFERFRGLEAQPVALEHFLESDDFRASYIQGCSFHNRYGCVEVEFFGVVPEPVAMLVEAQVNTTGLQRVVASYNGGSFDIIGLHDEVRNLDSVSVFPLSPEHIDPDGFIRATVAWRKIGFTLVSPWAVRIDQVGWVPVD